MALRHWILQRYWDKHIFYFNTDSEFSIIIYCIELLILTTSVKKKKQNPLILCVSPLLAHYYHTTLLIPNMWDFFPQKQAIICNTGWVPYDLTQYWHDLPGDNIRSLMLGDWSYKTTPHFRCQPQVVDPQKTHNFCQIWL